MQTTILTTSSVKAGDSLILLLDDNGNIPSGILSKEEADFVKKELKAERKTIIINQYKRLVILFQPDYKKDSTRLLEACRKAGDSFLGSINKQKLSRVVIHDLAGNSATTLAVAEGMALGNYQFLKYRKEKKKEQNSLHEIAIKSRAVRDHHAQELQYVVDAVCKARTLVNEPLSGLSASQLASEFVKLGKEAKFKVQVLGKSRIKALKMGGLLAVNQGSVAPPTFTIMEYKPRNAKNKKPFVLVGKGVVYDTGGLSLKPTPNSMDYMKSDMAGAAAVIGAIELAARLQLNIHLVGVVPSAENSVDANSIRPGDVINSYLGKSIEVIDTDAEGRLVLADGLAYIIKNYKPDQLIDLATLTGSVIAALGYTTSGMFTLNDEMALKLQDLGAPINERVWRMPMWEDYAPDMHSDIADIKNLSAKPVAGSVTAAKFLEYFTSEHKNWVHLDIAGVAFTDSEFAKTRTATAYGVRLLGAYMESLV